MTKRVKYLEYARVGHVAGGMMSTDAKPRRGSRELPYDSAPSEAAVRAMPAFKRHFTAAERERVRFVVYVCRTEATHGGKYWRTYLAAVLDGKVVRGYWLTFSKAIKSGDWRTDGEPVGSV